jgi:hypothetical protein
VPFRIALGSFFVVLPTSDAAEVAFDVLYSGFALLSLLPVLLFCDVYLSYIIFQSQPYITLNIIYISLLVV